MLTSSGTSPSGPPGHLPLQGEDLGRRTSPSGGGGRRPVGGRFQLSGRWPVSQFLPPPIAARSPPP
ncbi:hypothetical protein DDF62_13115 [Caulobacter radicis]|nr:hypothetical protein DDF62_13115 [Caulobacter radicis]